MRPRGTLTLGSIRSRNDTMAHGRLIGAQAVDPQRGGGRRRIRVVVVSGRRGESSEYNTTMARQGRTYIRRIAFRAYPTIRLPLARRCP